MQQTLTSRTALALAGVVMLTACGGGGDSTGETPTGQLSITVTTSGAQQDPNGFSIGIGATWDSSIAKNAEFTLEVPAATYLAMGPGIDLPPATVPVELNGIAGNCTATPSAVPAVVTADGAAEISFAVACDSTFGAIIVSTTTTGGTPDPDGYLIFLDGVSSGTILPSDTVRIEGRTPGDHVIQLVGLAANCSFTGAGRDTVTVVAGSAVTSHFGVACPSPGTIVVSTATTGGTPDPDGYQVRIDGAVAGTILASDTVEFGDRLAGTHSVQLTGLAANCTIVGETADTVTLLPGDSAYSHFDVSCPSPASISIVTETTGPGPHPTYSMLIDGGAPIDVDPTDTTSPVSVMPGSHTIALRGIGMHCDLVGDSTRTMDLAPGAAGVEAFSISCARPAVVFAFSVGSGGYTVARINPDGTYPVEVIPASTINGGRQPDALGPDGRITFVAGPTPAGRGLARMEADGTGLTYLFDSAGVTQPRWSPDGSKIVFGFAPGGTNDLRYNRIRVINANGGPATTLAGDTIGAFGADWSPTGDRIVYSRYAPNGAPAGISQLVMYDVATGDTTTILAVDSLGVSGPPRWSPDGTKIAIRCLFTAYCIVAPDGSGLQIVQTGSLLTTAGFSWSPDGDRFFGSQSFVEPPEFNLRIDLISSDAVTGAIVRLTHLIGSAAIEPSWY